MKVCASILKDHGLKVTSPRLQILRFLRRNRRHPTADEIYSALKGKNPSLSRTTVYNTLELLRSKGIIQALTITEKELRYEVPETPHHHFCCKVCGRIIEVDCDGLRDGALLDGKHQVDEFHGYYKGTCDRCLGKGPERKGGQGKEARKDGQL
jgi:Fe2+ or Zn2+ uptake regulation protein